MTTTLDALNLADDLEEIIGLEDAHRWKIQVCDNPLELHVELAPSGRATELYQARLLWSEYPGQAPSLKFRDPSTGRLDVPAAWPEGGPFRPTSFCACVSYTAEGFSMHPEWVRDPKTRWDSRGNVLLKVLRFLQDDLDFTSTGRHVA